MPDIIKQVNWLDIFLLILLFRIGYVAVKRGIAVEFFKTLGVFFSLYISLHYYNALLGFLRAGITKKKLTLDFLAPYAFIFLAILGYLVFVLLRALFSRIFKTEATPNFGKWGGVVLGIVRAVLLSSLILFALAISEISYFKKSIRTSYSGGYLISIAPSTYSWLWDNLVSKFMVKEKFNEAVLEVEAGLPR